MADKFDPNDLISQKEAAEIRGISVQAINSLIKRGRLKAIVIAGRTFLSRKDVTRYKPGTAGRPKKKSNRKERDEASKPRRTKKKP